MGWRASGREVIGYILPPLNMPWRCPVCDATVQHTGPLPLEDVVYRCHVCRLDLVTNPETGKMRLAPFDVDTDPDATEPPTKPKK